MSGKEPYFVGVVEAENATVLLLNVLVAAARNCARAHVGVVACHVQDYQGLENDDPFGEGGRQEDEQAAGGAAIRHHVEHSSVARGLPKIPGGVTVESVEEA